MASRRLAERRRPKFAAGGGRVRRGTARALPRQELVQPRSSSVAPAAAANVLEKGSSTAPDLPQGPRAVVGRRRPRVSPVRRWCTHGCTRNCRHPVAARKQGRALAALCRGDGRNAGAAAPTCARASGKALHSHHGARLPQRAAPVTPRTHPVRATRTSLYGPSRGDGRHAGTAAAGNCARVTG
jgi:hypothetical protein